MKCFGDVYRGRRVLVTGHTGFKGSWLSLWLTHLGAEVAGYSVDIPTEPSNFELLRLDKHIRHYLGDIRDQRRLAAVFDEYQPEIVFHMAAQALVRRSYSDPLGTIETNVMGMVNVLECVRARPSVQVAVLITSDKAYRNDEWCWGYRETDSLAGRDPYSGSKSCADIVAQTYFHSFLKHTTTRVGIARAGNVIGGGDWAEDRIVPDCIRGWSRAESVEIRNPLATRPWQHVLEPLSGYLLLGARLLVSPGGLDGEAFNFGPDARVKETVLDLISTMARSWPGAEWNVPTGTADSGHEATLLKLSCDKALFHMNWRAVLGFGETVEFTIDWYRRWYLGERKLFEYSIEQIERYWKLANDRNITWAES